MGYIGTMLDAGYWMLVEAQRRSRFSGDNPEFPRVRSRNIQTSASSVKLHPETSIQDHVILPMVFITTA